MYLYQETVFPFFLLGNGTEYHFAVLVAICYVFFGRITLKSFAYFLNCVCVQMNIRNIVMCLCVCCMCVNLVIFVYKAVCTCICMLLYVCVHSCVCAHVCMYNTYTAIYVYIALFLP